jgi:diguanylate cyclase (GGDEF)-like protein
MYANNKGLAKATAKLGDLTSRDALTGLWNQREFTRLMLEESRRAVRSRSSFCVAILSVDDFGQINERFGRQVGDTVLKELGQMLEISRRATDSIARYEGEQFTLLLITAKLGSATVALERIRHDVSQFDWEIIAPDLCLTVSAGVASWQAGETMDQVLKRAEATLQEAKTAGRNCVRVAFS